MINYLTAQTTISQVVNEIIDFLEFNKIESKTVILKRSTLARYFYGMTNSKDPNHFINVVISNYIKRSEGIGERNALVELLFDENVWTESEFESYAAHCILNYRNCDSQPSP